MSSQAETMSFSGSMGIFRENSIELDSTGIRVMARGRRHDVPWDGVRGVSLRAHTRTVVGFPMVYYRKTRMMIRLDCLQFSRRRPLVVGHARSYASAGSEVFRDLRAVHDVISRETFPFRLAPHMIDLSVSGQCRISHITFKSNGEVTSGRRTVRLTKEGVGVVGKGRYLRVRSGKGIFGSGVLDIPLLWDGDVVMCVVQRILERQQASSPTGQG